MQALLADPKINPNPINDSGDTPLLCAVDQGDDTHLDIVEALLDHPRTDVNAPDSDGDTPLLCATYEGDATHLKIIQALIDHPRTDVNALDANGYTALLCVSTEKDSSHFETVKALLNHPKIDIHYRDEDGDTALTNAASASPSHHGKITQAIMTALGLGEPSLPNKSASVCYIDAASDTHITTDLDRFDTLVHNGTGSLTIACDLPSGLTLIQAKDAGQLSILGNVPADISYHLHPLANEVFFSRQLHREALRAIDHALLRRSPRSNDMLGRVYIAGQEYTTFNAFIPQTSNTLEKQLRNAVRYAKSTCIVGTTNRPIDKSRTDSYTEELDDLMAEGTYEKNALRKNAKWRYHSPSSNDEDDLVVIRIKQRTAFNPISEMTKRHEQLMKDCLVLLDNRLGNCQDQSELVIKYLWENSAKLLQDGPNKLHKIELVVMPYFDHVFVLVNRSSTGPIKRNLEGLENAYVVDPWLKGGIIYPAMDYYAMRPHLIHYLIRCAQMMQSDYRDNDPKNLDYPMRNLDLTIEPQSQPYPAPHPIEHFYYTERRSDNEADSITQGRATHKHQLKTTMRELTLKHQLSARAKSVSSIYPSARCKSAAHTASAASISAALSSGPD